MNASRTSPEKMSVDKIQRELVNLGYEKIKKISGKRISFRTSDDRVDALKKVAQSLGGSYVSRSPASSAGIVNIKGGFSVIAKPLDTRGSGAGADATKLVETAQCVYCAAKWNSGNYSILDLKSAAKLVDVDGDLEKVHNELPEDWIQSCVTTAEILYKKLVGKKYTFHRGSKWVSTLQDHFKKLNRQDGGEFSNVNKWSPADIYMLSPVGEKVDVTKTRNLLELNSLLKDMIDSKDIIGVSLKKVGRTASFKYVNTKEMNKYVYESFTLGKRGFFQSKDVYINFDGGTIQYRTFPTWQGEIKGKTANQGKVSGGPTQKIIKRITQTNLNDPRRVNMSNTINNFYKYYSFLESSPLSKQEFIKQVEQKDESWYLSKFLGTELIYVIVKSNKQDYIMSSLIGYAASQSELSAPFVKVS